MKKEKATMTIAAVTTPGKEYCYNSRTAHEMKLPKKHMAWAIEQLNKQGHGLKAGEKWHMYTIDKYDTAWALAEEQNFHLTRTGYLAERRMYNPFA